MRCGEMGGSPGEDEIRIGAGGVAGGRRPDGITPFFDDEVGGGRKWKAKGARAA